MVKKLPEGCDQQGRYPEAAHAASEVDEYGLEVPAKFTPFDVVLWIIALCGVIAFVGVAVGKL